MATFVGQVGDKLHYANASLGIFFYRGLHIEVHMYGNSRPFILARSLGRVKNEDDAVDKVARIVEREKRLHDLINESIYGEDDDA